MPTYGKWALRDHSHPLHNTYKGGGSLICYEALGKKQRRRVGLHSLFSRFYLHFPQFFGAWRVSLKVVRSASFTNEETRFSSGGISSSGKHIEESFYTKICIFLSPKRHFLTIRIFERIWCTLVTQRLEKYTHIPSNWSPYT